MSLERLLMTYSIRWVCGLHPAGYDQGPARVIPRYPPRVAVSSGIWAADLTAHWINKAAAVPDLSLYVHVPFFARNIATTAPGNKAITGSQARGCLYLQALYREIELVSLKYQPWATVGAVASWRAGRQPFFSH